MDRPKIGRGDRDGDLKNKQSTHTLSLSLSGSLLARGVTERNMGQSPHLCFGSAGFCCWGLGMGTGPFLM